jgi:DNA polymerase-3 subunit delta
MAKTASHSLPFRVFYGAEDFFLDRSLERAKAMAGRSVTVLDGDGITDEDVVEACLTPGVEDGPDAKRAVVLDNANEVKGDKILKAYIETKDRLDTSVVLIAFVRSEKLSEVWKAAAEKGQSFEHRKLLTWDNKNQVVDWIEKEAKDNGIHLGPDLAKSLYTGVGSDLYRLASEIRKIALLVGEGGKPTLADLQLVVATSPAAEPWQVAEAVVSREPRRAMQLVSTVYKSMGDEAHVPITSALMKQVEKLVVARSMLDRNASEDEIAAGVDMKKGRLFYYIPQVRKHNLRELVGHMARLCKLDADVKGSASSKRTLVELAVLAIAAGEGVGA